MSARDSDVDGVGGCFGWNKASRDQLGRKLDCLVGHSEWLYVVEEM